MRQLDCPQGLLGVHPRCYHMLMTRPMERPEEYFGAVVEPAYADFVADPTSRHRAICGATIVYHFYERLYWFFHDHDQARLHGNMLEDKYLNFLASRKYCSDLLLLKDSADSVRHQFLNRRVATRLVTTSTDVTSLVGNEFYIGTTNRTVSDVLAKVMRFWRTLLTTNSP